MSQVRGSSDSNYPRKDSTKMNQLLRIIIFTWLLVSAIAAWIGCAVVGFFFAFTKYNFITDITPFMGLTFVICIMKCAMYVLRKSDPMLYINNKIALVENLLGKKKV